MPRYENHIKLPPVEDLFSTQEERDDAKREKVMELPLTALKPFAKHPFHVEDNEELRQLAESIRDHGVLTPALARPGKIEGSYELVSGHRRKAACELLGLETLPVIVREMDDDTATISMVDANKQREKLLPSEKAFSYKMKLEAMKHQGKATSRQLVGKLESADIVGQDVNESGRTIQRFIRLTNLVKPLLDMVDSGRIAMNPAVELSYLTREQQGFLVDAIETTQATPSYPQARELKRLSQAGTLDMDGVYALMRKEKPNQAEKLQFAADKFRKYFPANYTQTQIKKELIRLLEARCRRQEHTR